MIYFDNSATTFVSDGVKAKINELMDEQVSANPGALHKLGKSDIDIARELNMGVGEVSLIIGLHAK